MPEPAPNRAQCICINFAPPAHPPKRIDQSGLVLNYALNMGGNKIVVAGAYTSGTALNDYYGALVKEGEN